ncbi:MAG: zinc ribbon domain-containing protein [Candidatus Helarchaeota archaeon]
MDNQKLENLSNLMIERNLVLNILRTLSRDLELKEIKQDLYDVIRAKYTAKLDSLDIQIAKESRNFSCSKCEQPLEEDQHVLSCINCGFPFHEYHIKQSPISFENVCSNCGYIYHVKEINDFITIELKKVENYIDNLHSQISFIEISIDGKPLKLQYNVEKIKQKRNVKRDIKAETCPKCGNTVNSNWRYCKICGTFLKKKTPKKNMVCVNCGTTLEKNWKFCKWCGSPTGF